MELVVKPVIVSSRIRREVRLGGGPTGTVTRFNETLLIAIFIAYKTLNMTNVTLSDVESLFWTNNP